MSLVATCSWTLVRTIVLCLVAWPVCQLIERTLNQLPQGRRTSLLVALLLPCCFPELLVGYAFRDMALARPEWAEVLCSVLLLVRMIPVGTVALMAAPRPGLDGAALYCRKLARGPWRELVRCYWHGSVRRALPALALMSIMAFQEFELAALLQTMSWTDWFVTAERLGLERGEMLRQAIWPLLWQVPVLAGVLFWLRQEPTWQSNDTASEVGGGQAVMTFGVIFVVATLVVGCVIPLGLIGWRTVEGLEMLLRQGAQQRGLAKEIATSGAIAVCSGLTAWAISGRLRGLASNLLVLGLAGSLLLSLGFVALFQLSWLRPLYDTPLPWVLALIVWLLPRAAILRLWLNSFRNDEAIHLATLVGNRSRQLLWRLRDQSQFLAASLLCCWAYCDLPTAYMLAPTGMASGLVRLYNFMHFGRSAALSAEATVFFGVPVVCMVILLILNRSWR